MTTTLVIDDDTGLLDSLKGAAKLAKVDLVTASSWDEGLSLFQILSPGLVIADYNMPGTRHGLQLLSRIRQLRPSVRLVLVSGYLDDEDLDKVAALGWVDRALTKGSAVETADAVLDEARAASATAAAPTDWMAYAQAYASSRQLSAPDLQALDAILASKVNQPDD